MKILIVIASAVLALGTAVPQKCSAQTALHLSNVAESARLGGVVLLGVAASGQPDAGEIQGTTRGPSANPLPQVQVRLRSVDDGTDQIIMSGPDGIFAAVDLKPGPYELWASKEGFASFPGTTLHVSAGQELRINVFLSAGMAGVHFVSLGSGVPGPQHDGVAQAVGDPGAGQSTGGASDPPVPAAVWGEIDALKNRVDQLEAELHQRDSGGRVTSGVAETRPPANRLRHAAATIQTAGLTTATMNLTPVASTSVGGPQGITEEPVPASLPAPLSTTALNLIPPAAAPASPSASPDAASGLVATGWLAPTQKANKPAKIEPFSDADWSWLNGYPRTKNIYWGTSFFTPEIRADLNYNDQNHHPADHSLGGSSETFRDGEVQLEQFGVGGDFHWDNVRARFMTQFGMYSETTPRNDASPANGEWNLDTAYRYLSEAYGGYHFNVLDGINVDAGIFLSYIGLFSYYNFDNWAYQPSYVSSNTPWFFNGVRVQIFPTPHLKIEPWFINGWQSYGSANNRPGLGGQIRWTPYPWINVIANQYGLGHDDLYTPGRARIHTDDSVEIKYFDRPMNRGLDKMAFSFTGDLGCEYGGGVSCTGDHKGGPKQSFIGGMLYNRWWFDKDQFGLTLGGGAINNPGRYLVLLPPINGLTAPSAAINSPYFTENPGDKFKAWDSSLTFDWMPKQYITFRVEGDYRHADVPYWSGRGGITPPAYAGTPADFINGNGYPTEYVCSNGAPSGATALPAAQLSCGGAGRVWFPDLVKSEFLIDFDILVKF
jgi:hypothetical protein